MTHRRHLTWVSAWNICCSMKERKTSFWIILSESWCLHYDPDTKQESAVEISLISLTKQELHHTQCWCWHCSSIILGPLLMDWLPRGIAVNANCCGETQEHLITIKGKRPGMLSCGVILLHNSASSHSAGNSWEAAKVLVGSSSTSCLQSRLASLWLSCVEVNGKSTERSLLQYGCRCTGSSHIMASLMATGLLKMWYNGLMKLWDACLNNCGAYAK